MRHLFLILLFAILIFLGVWYFRHKKMTSLSTVPSANAPLMSQLPTASTTQTPVTSATTRVTAAPINPVSAVQNMPITVVPVQLPPVQSMPVNHVQALPIVPILPKPAPAIKTPAPVISSFAKPLSTTTLNNLINTIRGRIG